MCNAITQKSRNLLLLLPACDDDGDDSAAAAAAFARLDLRASSRFEVRN